MKDYIAKEGGMSAALHLKMGIQIFRHPKHFSEIYFSAIPILMKNSAKEVLIFICRIASASAGHFLQLNAIQT